MIGWLLTLVIVAALDVVAYLIAPKPKAPKPESAQEADNPKASAGSPIPVVFGTVLVKEVNVLWYGDKSMVSTQVDA